MRPYSDVIAVIPARLHSRRIPGKNTVDLGGRPLIEWTLDAARASIAVGRTIVTTDDDVTIPTIARASGADVVLRPPELSHCDASMWGAVKHALADFSCRVVVLLQPTSPFRTAADVDAAVALLDRSGGDAVISVTRSPPDAAFTLGHAGRLRPISDGWVENGAIWAVTSDALARGLDLYDQETTVYGYRMPEHRSLDINTPGDLEAARARFADRATSAIE